MDMMNATRIFNEGVKFHNGDDCEIDLIRSAECFKDAAEMGYPPAIYYYAIELASGKAIEQNVDLSIELMQKAAEMDYEPAVKFLGE